MNRIITVESKQKLEKMLSYYHPSNVEVVLISSILKSEMIDKEFTVHQYEILIPPPSIIARFLKDGLGSWYRKEYYDFLNSPLAYYFLNEIVYRLTHYARDMILVCAVDEQEFEYMPFIRNTIEEIYHITPITYKEWKKDKGMKAIDRNIDYLYDQTTDMRMTFGRKLLDSRYQIPSHKFIRMGKYDLQQLSKEERKQWKRLMKEEE